MTNIEDYARALPQTAQPSSPEPEGDPGHLLPDAVWELVVAGAQEEDK